MEKPSWPNDCKCCNGDDASDHSCCIICRNYTSIDKSARDFCLQNVIEAKVPRVETDEKDLPSLREYFMKHLKIMVQCRAECKDAREKYQQLADALEEKRLTLEKMNPKLDGLKSANNKAIDDYNAIAIKYQKETDQSKFKLLETQSEQAKQKVDSCKKELEVCETAWDTTEKSHQDLAGQLKFAEARDAELQKKLLSFNEECTTQVGRLAKSLIKRAKISLNDQIGCARFFFAWIASSISYNDKVETYEIRIPFVTILSGYEVCAGFSKLFIAMFDAISPNHKCVYIVGKTKVLRDTILPDENTHGWTAFPIEKGGNVTYKIIDCTWGAGHVNDSPMSDFRPTWFTKPNSEFLRTHIPEKPEYQYLDTQSPPAKSSFQIYTNLGRCTIDISSLTPQEGTLARSLTIFSYKKCCSHYSAGQMTTFALHLSTKDRVNHFEYDRSIWFKKDEKEDVWSVSVDLNDKKYREFDEIGLYTFYVADTPQSKEDGKAGQRFRAQNLEQLEAAEKKWGVNYVTIVSWDIKKS